MKFELRLINVLQAIKPGEQDVADDPGATQSEGTDSAFDGHRQGAADHGAHIAGHRHTGGFDFVERPTQHVPDSDPRPDTESDGFTDHQAGGGAEPFTGGAELGEESLRRDPAGAVGGVR